MTIDIVIRRAVAVDSKKISDMLLSQSDAYIKYFRPFLFDNETMQSRLSAAKNDCYWIISFGDTLVGFFMLRGFDAGYKTPSFGVVIPESCSGMGLSVLALNYSLSWCAANRVPQIMLKVHPDNLKAKKIYERFGFVSSGVDSKNNNIIMHRDLSGRIH